MNYKYINNLQLGLFTAIIISYTLLGNNMELKKYIDLRLPEIENILFKQFINREKVEENNFFEILNYPLKAGGKRLRPILTLLSTEAFDGDYNNAIIPACSLEMIHTYSLVHDDLPAMDNDDLRRGIPTTHKKYGEGNAILAGDGLLTNAFQTLSTAKVSDSILRKLLFELSYAAGSYGMVMGQYLDLYYENKNIDFEALKNIHAKKTGAMIRACVRIGALVSDVNEKELGSITKYGEAIGLAFQIRDDILDTISDNTTLGKTAHKDELSNKLTYVRQFGLEGALAKSKEVIDSAISCLDNCKNNDARETLIELAKYTIERNS